MSDKIVKGAKLTSDSSLNLLPGGKSPRFKAPYRLRASPRRKIFTKSLALATSTYRKIPLLDDPKPASKVIPLK